MTVALTHSFSSIKMFENCPLQYYEVRIAKNFQNLGGEATKWGERVHKHLEERLKDGTELPPESASSEPICQAMEKLAAGGELLVEQEATLDQSLQPTEWWGKNAWLRSKLDVLAIKGAWAAVFDWKTGKRRPDFSQLELFALQTFVHFPKVNTVHSKFLWIKEGKSDSEVYTRDKMPVLWEKLLTRIKRIEKAAETNTWPAKPSGLCPWCPVLTCLHHK
jgi:hypothetical protein